MYVRSGLVRAVVRVVMVGVLCFVGTTSVHAGEGGQASGSAAVVWTRWDARQNVLADDGAAIWIGTVMGAVRWDKATNAYHRYTPYDDLPSWSVYAVAVDAMGGRWFGGSEGLTLLDAGGTWTHFDSANSQLLRSPVVGIAAGDGGILWVSYQLPDGPVSRRDADGSWQHYPSREAAVLADYGDILLTRNDNPLWTVAGSDVWVDYWVYDGAEWQDRNPAGGMRSLGEDGMPKAGGPYPVDMNVDSSGRVWVTDGHTIMVWSEGGWTKETGWCGNINNLELGPDDTVWVAYYFSWLGKPPPEDGHYISPLIDDCPSPIQYWMDHIGVRSEANAMLASNEGLWAAGAGWLLRPDRQTAELGTPAFSTTNTILRDAGGMVWLHSSAGQGRLQQLDDRRTVELNDDDWADRGRADEPSISYPTGSTLAWDRVPNGDVWVTYHDADYYGWTRAEPPMRWHQGTWLALDGGAYGTTFHGQYSDVFVEDSRRVWFVAQLRSAKDGAAGVIGLDDGGTPAVDGDDVWRFYPTKDMGGLGAVAVDANGRIWYGNETGLYRWSGEAWERILSGRTVCDLTPAADGTLFVLWPGSADGCRDIWPEVTMIRPDEGSQDIHIHNLATNHLDLLRTATHRNKLWSVAPDGTVWYVVASTDYRLWGYGDAGVTSVNLPFSYTPGGFSGLEAASSQRVWLAAQGSLWRMVRVIDYGHSVRLPLVLAEAP